MFYFDYLLYNSEINLFYRFRIAAVYSNKDNKLGKISAKFYLQKGDPSPQAPVIDEASALPYSVQVNWSVSNIFFQQKIRFFCI